MHDVLEPPDEAGSHLPAVVSGAPSRHLVDAPAVDVAAFSAFYRTEIAALVNFLLWMGAGVTDAADLAQEAMIDAYQSWSSLQHPRAWTRRVASRKHFRRQLDQRETVADLADDHNPLLRVAADVGAWEQRHDVLRLLGTLPWRQRQVMAWAFDGYPPQEIAAELNITPEAARSSLKLARRALAAQLDQPGEAR